MDIMGVRSAGPGWRVAVAGLDRRLYSRLITDVCLRSTSCFHITSLNTQRWADVGSGGPRVKLESVLDKQRFSCLLWRRVLVYRLRTSAGITVGLFVELASTRSEEDDAPTSLLDLVAYPNSLFRRHDWELAQQLHYRLRRLHVQASPHREPRTQCSLQAFAPLHERYGDTMFPALGSLGGHDRLMRLGLAHIVHYARQGKFEGHARPTFSTVETVATAMPENRLSNSDKPYCHASLISALCHLIGRMHNSNCESKKA
ncbi:hypothetical protein K491DRAFT_249322 [Lophiostoma macrostomum CBS 122681]|uniref:Uncharacterized protein n=1 Tax=Lophiostoma macrostomum CBS 122681 TaxID=1314788 RepID=A0A6A6SN59_9PLEO|nr:hypothetical protein K491DRAFT_249322 [Lophiostoma macrostomum CBS 122681]